MVCNVVYVHGVGEIGGAEKDLLSYLCLLDRHAFRPHVVCPQSGALKGEVEKLDVAVEALQVPPWRKALSRLQLPWVVWKLVKIFRQWNADLIHVNDYWWGPPAYLAAKICRLPVIVHIRQQIEPNRIQQYWMHKPDALIPVSKNIEQVLLSHAVDSNRVHVAYSGVALDCVNIGQNPQEIRLQFGLSQERPIIGTVANLFPRKGYDYLLQALVQIKNTLPNIACLIIGEGPAAYQNQLHEFVEQNGLQSNVIFAGFQKNVNTFLNVFDVFVLPSILEGFGIVLLEAMALHKPIVASHVGGIPEIVTNDETGILVPPKDSNALAMAIVRLLSDVSTRRRLGEAGRKIVEERFSQEIAMIRIENIYSGCIALERN